jgi:hypothetical protein
MIIYAFQANRQQSDCKTWQYSETMERPAWQQPKQTNLSCANALVSLTRLAYQKLETVMINTA